MPIYEYRCQDCNHEFERMQKFSDPPVAACPACEGAVQKLISRSAFHLKGSGWYVTDYARNGGEKSDSPDKSAPEKTTAEKNTSDKSDAKAATASASSDNESKPAKKSPSDTAAA